MLQWYSTWCENGRDATGCLKSVTMRHSQTPNVKHRQQPWDSHLSHPQRRPKTTGTVPDFPMQVVSLPISPFLSLSLRACLELLLSVPIVFPIQVYFILFSINPKTLFPFLCQGRRLHLLETLRFSSRYPRTYRRRSSLEKVRIPKEKLDQASTRWRTTRSS